MNPLRMNETVQDYANSRFAIIETCRNLVNTVEAKAVEKPMLSQEIGETIRGNKDIIKLYERDLRALLD